MKYIFDVASRDKLELILSELAKANHHVRYHSVQYLASRVDLPEEEFIKLALTYLDEDDFMTVEEQMERRLTKKITEEITGRVTAEVAGQVTEEVTGRVTEEVTGRIVRKMLEKKLPITDISEVTGLSLDLIRKLKIH